MHIDPYIVLGSAIVGLLVGMTGAGGGALMTPMLILLFGVTPSAAISSDLVAAVVMRPIGAGVHLRARHGQPATRAVDGARLGPGGVPRRLPAATAGRLHSRRSRTSSVSLGAALLIGAAAMVLRFVLDRRAGNAPHGRSSTTSQPRPAADRRDRHRRRDHRRA